MLEKQREKESLPSPTVLALFAAVCQESAVCCCVCVLSDSSQTALLLFHLIGHEREKEMLSVPAKLKGNKKKRDPKQNPLTS